ncbi:hypothetical protein [Sphingopyxis sp. MSC1_008]|jgi:hypothetical protein|uniref:hypothetical protein n=1 Tax=Sphingopyxis sp. MSC1_008 TaxID=2909265 RepID=UPI0020C0F912|nr:hypothetical protein [Sphingopyxis sp. MSC1_008]
MSKMDLFHNGRHAPTHADIKLGSGLAANGNEQKVNITEMTAWLRQGGAMEMGTTA